MHIGSSKKCRHSLEEKRRLRNARKRRKRRAKAVKPDTLTCGEDGNALMPAPMCSLHSEETRALKEELANEVKAHEATKQQKLISRVMAKTFWERWRFELDRSKQLLKEKREAKFSLKHGIISQKSSTQEPCTVPKINRSLLCNPVELGMYSDDRVFVGKGSFGVVKYQTYRGIQVAVKEFLPHTLKESVFKEAAFLVELCHPYLPLLLGVCTSKLPYIIVIQYYGIGNESITILREIREHKYISDDQTWIILCAQLVEAFVYLHTEVNILHNDLKGDNVLLTTAQQANRDFLSDFQIVVIDFGKATRKNEGKRYSLSFSEKKMYRVYHSHLAPELIDGVLPQSVFTDIYSVGILFQKISKLLTVTSDGMLQFNTVSTQCTDIYKKRPTVTDLQTILAQIIKKM